MLIGPNARFGSGPEELGVSISSLLHPSRTDKFSASISGASAGVRLPSGEAAA
jgi:hypothetical protein